MKVTDEHVHDKKMLPKLVADIAKSKKSITLFGKILADGAYDSNDVFECLADNGILPCIKVRSRNARVNKEPITPSEIYLSYLKRKNDLQR